MKISQKLILGFVSVAMLVTAVGYFSVNTSKKTLEKTIGNASELLAAKMMEHIDTIIWNRVELIQCISKDLVFQEEIMDSNREFEILDNVKESIDQRDTQWVSMPKTIFMKELLDNKLSKTLKVKSNFYEKNYGYAVFGEIFVTNKYGANVAQTGMTTDYYQADEQWWQNAKNDILYVSDVAFDESSGIYSTDICIRINDQNDNFIGVIKATLNINETINFIKKTAEEEIEHRDFKLLSRSWQQIYETEEHEIAEPLPENLLVRFEDDIKTGHHTGFVMGFDNDNEENKVFAYAHSKGYKDFTGLGWIVVIENKTDQIFASVDKLKNRILCISMIVTVIAILIGLLISKSISNDITKVTQAASRIGNGDLDYRLEMESNNELGQLAFSFNKMADDLRTSTTSIDFLNKEISERKSVEKKLKYERNFTKNIIETAQTIILILDTEGKIVDFNPYMEKISGYSLAEVKGKDWFEIFIIKTDQQSIKELFKKAISDIQTLGLINTIVTKDGRLVKIEWYDKTLKDEGGNTIGLVSIGQDVTERKLVEEKLRSSQQLLEDIINAIPVRVFWKDKNLVYQGCNRTFAQDAGFNNPRDIIGKDDYQMVWVDQAKLYRTDDSEVINSGKSKLLIEEPQTTPDGNIITLLTSKIPLRNADGDVCGVIGSYMEITERQKAVRALFESEQRFQQIAESTGDWIWEIDQEGVYTYSNSAVEKFLGYKPEEIIGKKHFYDFFTSEIKEEFKKAAFEIFGKKENLKDFQNSNLHKNGSIVILETSGTPIIDDNGNLYGYRGTDRNITEHKQHESKQVELLKQVEKANQELKEFAYIASHDLKAPLRGIGTLADWIASDYGDKIGEEGKEQINLLLKRVERMQKLIDGILQYSRVGRIEEKKEDIDLNQLIPEIVDLIAPPEHISIITDNHMPVIRCEETRILQVFQNLISNAVKHMDKPEGQIKISCVEDCGFWKFSVADNGPGIKEEYFERIFQIFQTLSGHDDKGGTGIGLTLVKKIIELYGGRVWVESEVGVGSTFYFTLPKINGG